jgi:voltage-gated potassium channel
MTHGDRWHPYQLYMLVLCILALGALAVQEFLPLDPEVERVLEVADFAVCILFLADFVLTFARAPNRWRYFVTWGWIDLLSSIPAVGPLRWGRAVRVVRILRVLRAVRATRMLFTALIEHRAQSMVLVALLLSVLMVFFGSIAILQLETSPESNIRTAADAMWWAFVTITTVGYGDRFPVTPEGRLVGAALMTVGVGLFGTFSGLIASWFLSPAEAREDAQMAALHAELRELRLRLEQSSAARGNGG